MKIVLFAIGGLMGLVVVALFYYVVGLLCAWLFAQFGIVKPWWVFSVGWFLLTSLFGAARSAIK